MQKLWERNTYTPVGVPQARSNCGPVLNREETLSVRDLKSSSKNSNDSNKKVCACGCGQIIIFKPFHKYYGIPDYVNGHNKPIWSDKSRKKLSQSLKGKSKPKEWCKRNSEILKEGYKNGRIKTQAGIKKMSKEAREKIRLANLGGKNPNWQGGKSYETHSAYFKKKFRYLVWVRDKFICKLCRKKLQNGLSPNNSQRPHCHHIDYVKNHNSMDNCITLCTSCNTKVNFNRDYWEKYFRERLRRDQDV